MNTLFNFLKFHIAKDNQSFYFIHSLLSYKNTNRRFLCDRIESIYNLQILFVKENIK